MFLILPKVLMFIQYREIYKISSCITLHADCSTSLQALQQLLVFPFGAGSTLWFMLFKSHWEGHGITITVLKKRLPYASRKLDVFLYISHDTLLVHQLSMFLIISLIGKSNVSYVVWCIQNLFNYSTCIVLP